jgi:hypothetical protein
MFVFKMVAPTVLFILASPFIAHGQRSESSSGEPARGHEPKPQQALTNIREAAHSCHKMGVYSVLSKDDCVSACGSFRLSRFRENLETFRGRMNPKAHGE